MNTECDICYEGWSFVKIPTKLNPCAHTFCIECVKKLKKCAMCRATIVDYKENDAYSGTEVTLACDTVTTLGTRSVHECSRQLERDMMANIKGPYTTSLPLN